MWGASQPSAPDAQREKQPMDEIGQRWLEEFDPREQKSIDNARLYAAQFGHGDPGHLHSIIIAKMAALLDRELLGIKAEYVIDRRLVDISGG